MSTQRRPGADVDAVVIGAGVVGLAVGRALAAGGLETLVVERHRHVGEETSSRNSGVIHSGIYYPAKSLKARLSVRGRESLYEYCHAHGIAHRKCGKLIVAQHEQVRTLRVLHDRGIDNGVDDLRWLDADQVRDLEPAVHCAAALLSPSSGIVDVHELMTALHGDIESRGSTVLLNAAFDRARPVSGGIEITLRSGDEESHIVTRGLVNSAGLGAADVASRIEGFPRQLVPATYLAKGNYFSCTKRPFRHLVYPMPNDAGLGIHATLDLDGSVRFGPDVEWVQKVDYSVAPARSSDFYTSIREYWPGCPDDALHPAYAGIRTKLSGPGGGPADFTIMGPREHGMAGLVNLFGIESPGLTAALAIADHARDCLGACFP